jgi:BRCA1-associated protein
MLAPTASSQLYSIVIALRPEGVVATKDRDGREGDLCIDWIDYHSEKEVASDDTGLDAETDSWRYKAKGLGTVRKDENTEQQAPVRRQTQGTTELGSGVLHYLKHSQPLGLLESLEVKYNGIDLSGKKDPGTNREDTRGLAEEADKVIPEGQDGTLIAILAVPAYLGVVELADWLGAWNSRLEGLRMIRSVTSSTTIGQAA